MRITAVSVTLFKGENIPLKNVTSDSDLGLVRIETDEGANGDALLGMCVHAASREATTSSVF